MSPPGRPKGEYRSAQREGTPVSPNAITPEQRKSNARLAWLFGSIAVLLFVAFIVKSAIYGI